MYMYENIFQIGLKFDKIENLINCMLLKLVCFINKFNMS